MKPREMYLDTTFVMPFFYLDINVKGFSRTDYKEIIRSLDKIHFSEVSIIEAKAKSRNMGEKVNEKFNEGLSILFDDEKVVIHGYREADDRKFNELLPFGLDFFDRIILAQAYGVGNLLTEDSKLLKLKNPGINILNWDAIVREIGLKQAEKR